MVRPARLVWTNDEGEAPGPVTTVTFETLGETTRVVMCDLYPDKSDLDEAIASGAVGCFDESFEQLDAVLAGA